MKYIVLEYCNVLHAILDVLIQYIANYHILYSGQLEIRSSVYTRSHKTRVDIQVEL